MLRVHNRNDFTVCIQHDAEVYHIMPKGTEIIDGYSSDTLPDGIVILEDYRSTENTSNKKSDKKGIAE